MGSRRLGNVLFAAAIAGLGIGLVAPVAVAAPTAPVGTGTSEGTTSLLNLVLGSDALGLRILGEDSLTSNDLTTGGPSALERVSPLQLTSTLVPALAGLGAPTVETRSTAGEDAKATPAIDLSSLLTGSPVPGLLSGTIDSIALRSVVDATGATSAAQGAVRDIAVLGGLLRTGTATADLGSAALSSDADAVRGLALDSVEVLDLQALLDSLGLGLADLPIDAAIGLLDQLGLALPGGLSPAQLLATVNGLLDQTSTVRAQTAPLQAQIDALQAQLSGLTSQLSTATALVSSLTAQLDAAQTALGACIVPLLCAPLQALVTSLTSQLSPALAAVTNLDTLIDTAQAAIETLLDQIEALVALVQGLVDQLTGLLEGVLDGLEGASLLSVDDLVVGVTARATDSLDTSVATVVGSVGDVRIGALSLGGLDPLAVLGQVTALTDQITGTLGGVLGTIDPSLAGLVDIALLEQTTSLTQVDGLTDARAAITGLRATITPPDVCALLATLGLQDTLGGVLGQVGTLVPALPGPVGDVLGDLGSTVACTASTTAKADPGGKALVDGVASALTQPLTVEALTVSGASTFSAPVVPVAPVVPGVPATPGSPSAPGTPGSPSAPVPGTLPATGGEVWLILAVALGAAGLGTRRLLVRSA